MDAGHAHVVAAHDVVSQELRRHRRLFGHGHVARPRRRHDDAARARRCGQAADDAEPCLGAVGERGQRRCKRRRLRLVHARHQHARLAAFRQCAADALDLGSGLPLAVHDLAHALAHAARQVGLGIAQILERRPRQPRRGLVGRQRAGLHRRQHLGQFPSIHVSSFRPCAQTAPHLSRPRPKPFACLSACSHGFSGTPHRALPLRYPARAAACVLGLSPLSSTSRRNRP